MCCVRVVAMKQSVCSGRFVATLSLLVRVALLLVRATPLSARRCFVYFYSMFCAFDDVPCTHVYVHPFCFLLFN